MEINPNIVPFLNQVEELMLSGLAAEDQRIYGLLAPFIKRGGKRIRPSLCFLSCGSIGGKYSDSLPAASIIELFHNFTLVHDDIEDNSDFRRGEPTLHKAYGIAMALNSGDALYTYLWKLLVNLPLKSAKLVKIQKLYADAFKRVVDGQGIEISWIRDNRFDVGESEYLQMIGGKTSALIGLSCEVGAFLGDASASERRSLRSFGERLGLAFQIHDDVLNLVGDFEKYKKEIGGDISEGKRTLIVVHCLSHASAGEKARLMEILRSHTKDKMLIGEAITILKNCGSIDYAKFFAQKLVAQAKSSLKSLPDSDDKTSLLKVADFFVTREV